ncbi:MAG: hypothetical protein IT447_15520 [Phycisphaerales bacterium]|nr:hypothetical protein [Phycisphaerales bacterium]
MLDTLSFRQIDALHEYRDQLWKSEGLDQSWIGTTANGFAWAGTGLLYSAALVYAWGAAGKPTMDVAIRYTGQAPKYVHFEYGANGVWQQAVGERGAMWIIRGAGEGLRITGIPVLSSESAMATGAAATAYNCFTVVARALFKGWGDW